MKKNNKKYVYVYQITKNDNDPRQSARGARGREARCTATGSRLRALMREATVVESLLLRLVVPGTVR